MMRFARNLIVSSENLTLIVIAVEDNKVNSSDSKTIKTLFKVNVLIKSST